MRQGGFYWGKNGDADFPVEKKYLSEVKEGVVNQTWWPYDFAGSTRNASAELKGIYEGQKSFDTPKPEKLLQRVLELATNPGDLVIDSFAGSGTTGAVAHKMGRRWIMVELGEHCHTHIIPRLKKVIDGKDMGGVTEAVGWSGGGGFRYFRLAPSLLEKDQPYRQQVYTLEADMNWQERIDNYDKETGFPHSLFVAGDGRVVGTWILGNDYRVKSGFYGGYPAGYLKRVRSLFPDKQKVTAPVQRQGGPVDLPRRHRGCALRSRPVTGLPRQCRDHDQRSLRNLRSGAGRPSV